MTDRKNRFIEQSQDINKMITILDEEKKPIEKPKEIIQKDNVNKKTVIESPMAKTDGIHKILAMQRLVTPNVP